MVSISAAQPQWHGTIPLWENIGIKDLPRVFRLALMDENNQVISFLEVPASPSMHLLRLAPLLPATVDCVVS